MLVNIFQPEEIRRRSKRLSTLAQLKAETKPVPLESTSLWCDADQEHHKDVILNLINTANLKMLQSIPAIGPKTAYLIQSYR